MSLQIAIQGYNGSFHQVAALLYYQDAEVVPCATFRELIKVAGNKKQSDGGVMAIENSIAGSILPNYNLLQKSNLKIVGEIYLHIKQNLLVNPGVKMEDIREVHSHPMALLQCMDFFDKHKWKLVETEDTALSAQHIHRLKSKHIAAVANKLSAELYGLHVLAPNIHTIKNNYTRFLMLQREGTFAVEPTANKASINFFTDHSKGSLANVLSKIASCNINLSKLQSMPIPGSDWKYSFHADMEFEKVAQFKKALQKIEPITQQVTVYGLYKSGKTI